jgi:hypothetical protein
VWTFTAVPPGSGNRMGIDRDQDGLLDGEDGVLTSGAANDGCAGAMHVHANLEPQVKTPGFALVVANAPPSSTGVLVANVAPARTPGPFTRLDVAASPLLSWQVLTSDGEGFAVARAPIPDQPALAGHELVARAFFEDACAGTLASEVLRITIQP